MKEFLNYIHWFRGFVILLIVERHCRQEFLYDSSFEKIMESVDMSSTILFVFLSGFLFQFLNTGSSLDYYSYLRKKFINVVVPYIILSIPAIINNLNKLTLIWMPDEIENPFLQVIFMLLTGKHLGTFWFMPMIFIFYLLAPLLKYLDQQRFYKYLFPLIFFGGLFTYQYGHFVSTIDSFIYFMPIYLLGMFASYYRRRILELGYSLAAPLLGLYLTITIFDITNIINIVSKPSNFEIHADPYFIFNLTKLKVSVLCLSGLIFFNRLNAFKLKPLKILGDYSFGIYFLHMYLIIAFRYLPSSMQEFLEGNPFNLIVSLSLNILGSMLIIYLVKTITGKYSRMFIGS